jgi:hypothetical protein
VLDSPTLAPAAPQSTQANTGLSPDQKRAIATFITEQSNLYKFCW